MSYISATKVIYDQSTDHEGGYGTPSGVSWALMVVLGGQPSCNSWLFYWHGLEEHSKGPGSFWGGTHAKHIPPEGNYMRSNHLLEWLNPNGVWVKMHKEATRSNNLMNQEPWHT